MPDSYQFSIDAVRERHDKAWEAAKIKGVENTYSSDFYAEAYKSIRVMQDIPDLLTHVDELGPEIEQLRVQLAGCLVAAEGHATGENDCKQTDYGWSLAFQATKELRQECDRLKAEVQHLSHTAQAGEAIIIQQRTEIAARDSALETIETVLNCRYVSNDDIQAVLSVIMSIEKKQ